MSAVIRVCRNLAAFTATTWQCLELHTGWSIYSTWHRSLTISSDMPRRFFEGICAAIHRCPRSYKADCLQIYDHAGICVYLRWKTKEFFRKSKVRTYFYHSYVLFHLITANIISNHHVAQPAIFSEHYFHREGRNNLPIKWTFKVSCTICDLQYLRHSLLALIKK